MGILLLFFSFITLVSGFYAFERGMPGLRHAWISACLVFSAILVFSTEVFSLFNALTQTNLAIFWGAVLLVSILVVRGKVPRFRIGWAVFENRWLNIISALIPSGLLAATFLIAIVAPPNNTDAMVYHMSRVAHWAQQHSVGHFPTSTLRELFLNPLAEYSILHTYLLSASDRFAHLIQWFAYLTSAIAVSLITEQLGGSKKSQYLAALFAMTVPQALLQATTTQNDLTFSAYALITVYLIIRFTHEGDRRWLLYAAAAAGLSILVKSTSFIVLAPFIIWAGVMLLKRRQKADIKTSGLAVLIVFLLIFPFHLRNFQTFGSPLGPPSETSLYKNDQFNLKVLASNTVRNLAINFTYTPGITSMLERAVEEIHQGLNLPASDPGTTWQGYQFSIPPFTISEDESGSPLHIWLVLIGLVLMITGRKRFPSLAHWLAVGLGAGFLLFSAYLKWQPWNNRLELVFFLLAAPLSGLAAGRIKNLPLVFSAGFFLCSLPYFYFNPTKPLTQDWNIFNLPRLEMMIRREDILAPYINSAFFLRDEVDCRQIGMDLENGAWEYPLWNMLTDPSRPEHSLTHINVGNESLSLESQSSDVCAVLLVDSENRGEIYLYEGREYLRAFYEPPVGVYSAP